LTALVLGKVAVARQEDQLAKPARIFFSHG
jgi:hypothetical protein